MPRLQIQAQSLLFQVSTLSQCHINSPANNPKTAAQQNISSSLLLVGMIDIATPQIITEKIYNNNVL
jgi:hypothetical protein